MLEYAHRTPFYIPHDQAVKDRIIKMSDAMKKGLAQIFKVISSHDILSVLILSFARRTSQILSCLWMHGHPVMGTHFWPL
jgi:hypothetical protein